MVRETPYPAATLPAPLDIVWGRFPYDERPGVPGPICHPCLVMEWREYQPGKFSVLVVFGSSKLTRADRGSNFIVSKYSAQKIAGLCKETMFDLSRWKWLTWTDRWFESPDDRKWSTPVIGKIEADGAHILRYVLQQRAAAGLPTPPRPTEAD